MDLRRVRKRSLKLREMQEAEEYGEMQEAQDTETRQQEVRDAAARRQQSPSSGS